MKAGLVFSAALFAAAAAIPAGGGLPAMKGFPLPVYAVQDVSMAMAGVRRFGGDLAFIELLQYLSSRAGVEPGHDEAHDHEDGHEHSHAAWFPQTLPYALRVLSLSPYFHTAHLFSAGTLGFVLDRPGDALALLQAAARIDPTFWRYSLYAGAIAYRRDEAPDKVIALLEEALKYPDCPGMLQNILAKLHKKAGRFTRAADIYAFTISTSKDPNAVSNAVLQLERMRKEGLIP